MSWYEVIDMICLILCGKVPEILVFVENIRMENLVGLGINEKDRIGKSRCGETSLFLDNWTTLDDLCAPLHLFSLAAVTGNIL